MNKKLFVLNYSNINDIYSQFSIIFSEYKGRQLMVYDETKNEYICLINNKKMVQFDDRKDHFVTKLTEGGRYSIVFYESYDTSYDYQLIFTGVKAYTQI